MVKYDANYCDFMVYIHWRTPTFHLAWKGFSTPPLTAEFRLNSTFFSVGASLSVWIATVWCYSSSWGYFKSIQNIHWGPFKYTTNYPLEISEFLLQNIPWIFFNITPKISLGDPLHEHEISSGGLWTTTKISPRDLS